MIPPHCFEYRYSFLGWFTKKCYIVTMLVLLLSAFVRKVLDFEDCLTSLVSSEKVQASEAQATGLR